MCFKQVGVISTFNTKALKLFSNTSVLISHRLKVMPIYAQETYTLQLKGYPSYGNLILMITYNGHSFKFQ